MAEPTAGVTRYRPLLRFGVALLLAAALVAYVITIFNGTVKPDQRLGIVDLVVILVGTIIISLLVAPELLDHIQSVNVGDLKLELRELRYHQQLQKEELDRVRLALELAVTETERKHLTNLSQPGEIVAYQGTQTLRIELRRLRTLDLIRSKKYIGEIPEGRDFNLRDFVELTDRGRDYLRSIVQ